MARASVEPVSENDPNPGLRAELEAAREVLDPQIRGLTNLTKAAITYDLSDLLKVQISEHTQRRSLIEDVINKLNAVLEAMVALKADGYPTRLVASAPALLFAELAKELAALQAAVAIFQEQSAGMSIGFGEPVDKP